MVRTINNYIETQKKLTEMLVSKQIDSFQVFSLEIRFNFTSTENDKYGSCWLCTTGKIEIANKSSVFDSRPEVISRIYEALGDEVSDVSLLKTGAIEIHFSEFKLRISPQLENLETIWSLTPGTPDPFGNHEWSIFMTDCSELVLKHEK